MPRDFEMRSEADTIDPLDIVFAQRSLAAASQDCAPICRKRIFWTRAKCLVAISYSCCLVVIEFLNSQSHKIIDKDPLIKLFKPL